MNTIAIAADHAGYALKEAVKEFLAGDATKRLRPHLQIIDLGTDSDARVDYPDFARALAQAITDGKAERGIVICGSGIGITIAANRFPKIRAANCVTVEMAQLARAHNDANVLGLGARLVDTEMAIAIVKAFLETPFEGGRHTGRIEKLSTC
ncbi:MAG: ribose 5-phosphate isomerase B [Alphaproteobacteria bacterium]|nr:ribose 5-phosphate isomerase B [Alphaproteobacteria bacterium]